MGVYERHRKNFRTRRKPITTPQTSLRNWDWPGFTLAFSVAKNWGVFSVLALRCIFLETVQKRGATVAGYSPERRAEIIEAVIQGISKGEPLREICRRDGFPNYSVVYDWMKEDENFSQRFARARDEGHDAIAEECLSIADNASNDWMEANDPDNPGYRLNGDHVQRSKLRIDTRLKLLAKWNPKKYGEKLELAGDQSSPLTVVVKQYTPPNA